MQAYAQLNNRISSQTFIGVLGHPAGARCTVGGPGGGPGGGAAGGGQQQEKKSNLFFLVF